MPDRVGHDKEEERAGRGRGKGMTREEEGQDGGEKGFPERGAFGEWVLFDVMCLLLLYSSYAADAGHVIAGLVTVFSCDISYFLTINCSSVLIFFIIRIIERVISISAAQTMCISTIFI